LRIGIDVGGTFTDFVALDRDSGRLVHHKEPSTPASPAEAVESGTAALLKVTGAGPGDVEMVVHGTTIALNAILQRRGAKVALVTSKGNRDLLEIARLRITDPYDFFAMPEAPVLPRDRVVELPARLDADGSIAFAPTDADIEKAGKALAAMNVDSVAVVILNAFVDPDFEIGIAKRLAAYLPGINVTASSEIWPEMREYERGMVCVLNAYVTPIMHAYYDRLAKAFAAQGVTAPLSITANNGGTIDLATARDRPIESILSGPAAGVVASIDAAKSAGLSDIVTFDMGGTSADIAVAEGDAPEITTRTMIGEVPLIMPVVNVGAIGAGGGSIVRVDDHGFLKVGPRSAGADPGPACYDRGGKEATISDCYLVCGYLDPDAFLGGRLKLSRDLANGVVDTLAERLGFTGANARERAAEAALKVASSMMATEIRKLLAQRGSDPAGYALVPYGGAGPTHAAMLAGEAGMKQLLVAPTPGTFCALGAIVADLRRDFVRSTQIVLNGGPADAEHGLAAILAELEGKASAWMATVGDRVKDWRFEVTADMRYPGQAFDLPIILRDYKPGAAIAGTLNERFHTAHKKLYEYSDPKSHVEVSRVVVSGFGATPSTAMRRDGGVAGAAGAKTRRVFIDSAWHEAARWQRDAIPASTVLNGPLVVEQADTTTIVPPGWTARLVGGASLLVEGT